MPTPGGSSRKNRIVVTIGHNGSAYEAVGGNVDLIGEKRGQVIHWRFNNPLPETLNVTVRNFSGSDCPVELPGCTATVQVRQGHHAELQARIKRAASPGRYTYAIHVHSPQTGHGNDIDPELQIDDMHFFHQLIQSPIAMAVAVVVLVALAWWFFG